MCFKYKRVTASVIVLLAIQSTSFVLLHQISPRSFQHQFLEVLWMYSGVLRTTMALKLQVT